MKNDKKKKTKKQNFVAKRNIELSQKTVTRPNPAPVSQRERPRSGPAASSATLGGSRPTINIEGGTVVYSQQFSTMITTEGGVYTYDTGGYTPVGRVTYDRVKHTATVDMKTGSRSGAPIPYLR